MKTAVDVILPLYAPQGDWCERIVECVMPLWHYFEKRNIEATLIITNDGAPMCYYPEKKLSAIRSASCGRFIFAAYDGNRGKGYSLRYAANQGTGDYQIYTDGDFPFGWKSVASAVEQLMSGADVVMGTRGEEYSKILSSRRRVFSSMARCLNQFMLGIPKENSDTQAGLKGFNAIGRKEFLSTTVDSFVFDMEFILRAFKKKLTIATIPLTLRQNIAMSQMKYKTLFREFMEFLGILWTMRICAWPPNREMPSSLSPTAYERKWFRKKQIWRWAILVLLLLIQCAFVVCQGTKKHGLFIDEIYTYGLANCAERPFLNYQDAVQDKWTPGKYFHDYLCVEKGHRFNYGSVYRNQVHDVHPPLYYMTLHTICSFFPETYSKWTGISLNILLFIVTQVFLYTLVMNITRNDFLIAIAVLVLYGSSLMGINTVTYIRMYMMLTMFAVATYYFHVKFLLKNSFSCQMLAVLGIITYLGSMTQYYFLILSFWIAFVTCGILIWQRRWLNCFKYGFIMLCSVALVMITFPALFEHLFGGRLVGNTTLENASRIGELLPRCLAYMAVITTEYIPLYGRRYGCIFLTCILVGIAICLTRHRKCMAEYCMAHRDIVLIGGSLVLAYITIALVSFDVYARYIYFLYPIFTIVVCVSLFNLVKIFACNSFVGHIALLTIVTLIGLMTYTQRNSLYFYNDVADNASLVKQSGNSLGVVFIENNSQPVLTEQCLSLMQIDEVYCTAEENIETALSELSKRKAKSALVWIDTNELWCSGYDTNSITSKILAEGGFTRYKKLYSTGLSDCLLFTSEMDR